MMEKIKKLVFALVAFSSGILLVYAECDFTEINELNALAVNVKASYEPSKIEVSKDEFFNPPDGMTEEEVEDFVSYRGVFNIYIDNIVEELYVTVYDKLSGETKTYNYSDADNGRITIIQTEMLTMNSYKIVVYSSDKTNCPDTKLFTLTLDTPYFNELSTYAACDGIEEFYLCKEFLTVENASEESFFELVEQYKANKVDKNGEEIIEEEIEDKSFWNFIKEHKIIIIGVSLGIILVGGVITVIILKKRRSKEEYE